MYSDNDDDEDDKDGDFSSDLFIRLTVDTREAGDFPSLENMISDEGRESPGKQRLRR